MGLTPARERDPRFKWVEKKSGREFTFGLPAEGGLLGKNHCAS